MSSSFSVGVSIFRSIMGCGILAMPYAMRRAGVIPTVILFVIVFGIAVRTTTLFAKCSVCLNTLTSPLIHAIIQRTEEDDLTVVEPADHATIPEDIVTVGDICERAFGKTVGAYVAWSCLMPCQWIVAVSYMVFIGHNTSKALNSSLTPEWVLVIVFVWQCVLCSPRSTHYLVHTAHFGNIALVIGIACIAYYAVFDRGLDFEKNVEMLPTSVDGVFEAFGIFVFGFSAYAETIAILSCAGSNARKNIGVIITVVMGIVLVVYIGFALMVYSAFGVHTKAITFDNLPHHTSVRIVRVCMSAVVINTYPLVVTPFFHVVEALTVHSHDTVMRLLSRWTIVFTTAVSAFLCGDSFGPVTAIGGGLGAILGFVLPPILYRKIVVVGEEEGRRKTTWYEDVVDGITIVIGVGGMITSIGSALDPISQTT